jgi:hypothetical protein
MPYDVFISHTKEDERHAEAALAALESAGLRCWIAPRDIDAGKDWGAEIVKAITGSGVMLVIFSSHANRSNHITREVNQADEKGLPVITFRVEDTEPQGSLEYFLDSTHWLDAFPRPKEKHAQLIQTVRRLLSEGTTAKPPDEKPPPRPTAFPKWPLAVVVGLLAAAVVVAILLNRRVEVNNNANANAPAHGQVSPAPTAVANRNGASIANNEEKPAASSSPVATSTPPDATSSKITALADVLLKDDSGEASRRDAIVELEQLARQDLRYDQQVVVHLAAFIRKQTASDQACADRPVRPAQGNVQAALTALARRRWWYGNGETERVNLSQTDLRGAELMIRGGEAHFEGVVLRNACLDGTKLMDADFSCAILSGASVNGIDVNNTDFDGADLGGLRNKREKEMDMARPKGRANCPP